CLGGARQEEGGELEREDVLRPFEEVASAHDRGRGGWYRGVLVLLRGKASAPLLDAGCGTGFIACKLALQGLGTVVCLEISRAMLKIAWRRALRWGVRASIHPVCASILRLPFRQSSFSSVVAAAVLHHVYGRMRRVEALRELLRVSRGYVLLIVWSALAFPNVFRILVTRSKDILVKWRRSRVLYRYYHLYTPCELREDLREAGYKNFKVFTWDYKRRLMRRNIVVEAHV
ncbi:MAG: hypothetical protein DRK00_01795, partial [Thermoprotei archaeon]